MSELMNGVKSIAKNIGSKLAAPLNDELAKRFVVRSLASMPGLPSKASQVLGDRFEISNQSMPARIKISDLDAIIERESPDLAEKIDRIDEDARPASLGQVHRVVLKDGQELAVKFQYPGIRRSVLKQLDMMETLFDRFGPAKQFRSDIKKYQDYLREVLDHELDYQREVREQSRFHQIWSGDSLVRIPRPYSNWSTDTLLVQEYIEGTSLESERDNSTLRKSLPYFLLNSIFNKGWVHGDLHTKNLGYSKLSNQLVVYDFGVTFPVSKENQQGLLQLIRHSEYPLSYPALLHAYTQIGFDQMKLMGMGEDLSEVTRTMFAPFSSDKWDPKEWNIGRAFRDTFEEKKWYFRTAGPTWFLTLMRTVSGWRNILIQLEGEYDVNVQTYIYRNQNDRLSNVIPSIVNSRTSLGTSSHLKVSVKENGEEKVFLELPVQSVDNIETLLPERAREVIQAEGYDLDKVRERVIRSNYEAQILFEARSGVKEYKVWIE